VKDYKHRAQQEEQTENKTLTEMWVFLFFGLIVNILWIFEDSKFVRIYCIF
jgi:hypothetical protein